MAQFDVHPNPNRNRDSVPFLVVLQSARYDHARTRFVGALMRSGIANSELHWLAPRFIIQGIEVVLDVFNLATLPADRLGPAVASLADDEAAGRIVRAIDEFTTRA